jgi:UDP-glucose 4-epimerase
VPAEAKFVEGDVGDHNLVRHLLLRNKVDVIIHFAGFVVPESVADPLGYYLNNTCKSRSLLAVAVETKVPHFIFSSTAAVYGVAEVSPVTETIDLKPISPYGSSKLITEIILRDTSKARCDARATRPRSSPAPERIQKVLGWEPKLNDLDMIVGHSLAWEKRLREDRRAAS